MLGDEVHVHHRAVGEERDGIDAWHVGNERPAADIDEDAFGLEDIAADANGVGRLEARVAGVDGAVLGLAQSGFDPCADAPEISSLRALTRAMSIVTPPTPTPNSAARRARCAAYALATIVLVGMQPVLTQVPPKRPRSITATLLPERARRLATKGPACPVPMTMASNRVAMIYLAALPAA